MAASGSIQIKHALAQTNPLDLSTPIDSLTNDLKHQFTNGTGDNNIGAIFHDTRSVGTGGESLDLSGGSLADGFGNTITFVKVKSIHIQNNDATNNLLIGGAANLLPYLTGATDQIVIPPGGSLTLVAPKAGYTVTGGTGDLLTVAASASTVSYNVIVSGTTA